MQAPYILAVSAFPSCGKTVTSHFLGRSLALDIIASSAVRQDFGWAQPGSLTPHSSAAEVEVALQRQSALAYRVLQLSLRTRLLAGEPVLVEGTFNTEAHRQLLYELLEDGVAGEVVIVRCECSAQEVERRLDHRQIMRLHGFDPGPEILDLKIYEEYQSSYQPVADDRGGRVAGVSIIEYRTDLQRVRAVAGCDRGTRGNAVRSLLDAFAAQIARSQPDREANEEGTKR